MATNAELASAAPSTEPPLGHECDDRHHQPPRRGARGRRRIGCCWWFEWRRGPQTCVEVGQRRRLASEPPRRIIGRGCGAHGANELPFPPGAMGRRRIVAAGHAPQPEVTHASLHDTPRPKPSREQQRRLAGACAAFEYDRLIGHDARRLQREAVERRRAAQRTRHGGSLRSEWRHASTMRPPPSRTNRAIAAASGHDVLSRATTAAYRLVCVNCSSQPGAPYTRTRGRRDDTAERAHARAAADFTHHEPLDDGSVQITSSRGALTLSTHPMSSCSVSHGAFPADARTVV